LPISTDGMASWDTFAFFVLVLPWIVILKHRKLTCAHAPRDRT
jgi:hypothetical protein